MRHRYGRVAITRIRLICMSQIRNTFTQPTLPTCLFNLHLKYRQSILHLQITTTTQVILHSSLIINWVLYLLCLDHSNDWVVLKISYKGCAGGGLDYCCIVLGLRLGVLVIVVCLGLLMSRRSLFGRVPAAFAFRSR